MSGAYAGFFARAHTQYDQLAIRGATDSVDDRRTPPHIFGPLADEFMFTLDAAASPSNALCPAYFGIGQDGLAESWAGERVWCNPPYSDLAPWVRKAWLETDACDVIVLLVPANRTEQGWWQDMVEPFRDSGGALAVRFLRGRIDFDRPDGTRSGGGPPFGCALLIWQSPDDAKRDGIVHTATCREKSPSVDGST